MVDLLLELSDVAAPASELLERDERRESVPGVDGFPLDLGDLTVLLCLS